MRSDAIVAGVFVSFAACAAPEEGKPAAEPAAEVLAEPHWIWCAGPVRDGAQVAFQRELEVGPGLELAILVVSCDDHFELAVNGGEVLARGDDWAKPVAVDVTEALAVGRNCIALRGRNDAGPAGLVAWLELEYADGARARLVTDGTWWSTAEVPDDWGRVREDEARWSAAQVLAPLGSAPWTALVDPTPAQQVERALAGEELEVPEGFRAELLYSVPREREGSWVALCEDERGRFYVSDQTRGLYRVTVPELGARRPVEVERLEVELAGAQGLEWAFGGLYAVVNAGGGASGLYRLEDTDGDDALDRVELLEPFAGEGEHGPHAVRLAPEGDALYVIAGNHTLLPAGVRVRPWGEDQLLTRYPDPGGHAVDVMAPGGWLCRTDPEGESWELVAWGMRNAYDFDFSGAGEPFTYDSDMEWDIGLPWYRPTRVLHLVQEGEFGWRHGSGKWPAYYPDSLPAAVDMGIGSPTGVAFGTPSAFPAPWRDAFFALDWSYGTIYAVWLEPQGVSFTGSYDVFLRGKPLPVTDVLFARDGAMYFTTGGRGTQSGLYRVVWEGDGRERTVGPSGAEREELEQKLKRFLERQAAAGEGAAMPEPVAAPASEEEREWARLAEDDRFVRFAARTELEGMGADAWRALLEGERDPRVVAEGCVALARVGTTEDMTLLLTKLGEFELAELDDEALIGMLRALELGFIRLHAPDEAERARAIGMLDPLFPADRAEVDRELARLLVYLDAPGIVPRALEAMRSAESHQEGLHYAFVLRHVGEGWTLAQRREFFDWLDMAEAESNGGRSFAEYVDGLRSDLWDAMSEEQRAVIDPWRRAKSERKFEALDLTGRPVTRWTIEELLPVGDELEVGRSFDTGRKAFAAATCYTCHRIAGEGGGTGPDLSGAGARFGARDLLEAIVAPSVVVSDQYRDTEVMLADEELLVGRLLVDDAEKVVLLTLPPEEDEVEVERSEVASIRPHPLSRMPEGLVDQLTREEVLDLMAFLVAGGVEVGE